MRDGRQFEWGGQGGAPHRLTEVTIRRDLKEVREQSPPGPEAGAGRSRLGQWEECSRPQC